MRAGRRGGMVPATQGEIRVGRALIPCDYRLYDKANDGLSKNDHFRAMLATARARGFAPECVVFDSWYASLANLKANRTVNPDGSGNRPPGECAIAEGERVHLQGYGAIPVFQIVPPDGDREYWATSDLTMGELARRKRAEIRVARAQRNHVNCAIRAFLRLEQHRLVTGVGWWEAKMAIIREAIRLYLARPRYTLASAAEATA